MALQLTDLLVVQRPATKEHFKIEMDDVLVPDGNAAGDMLIWSGTEWEPKDTIDGGTY